MVQPPDSGSDIDVQGATLEPLPDALAPEQALARLDSPDGSQPPGRRQTVHWRSLSDAILFTLIIAGPTMFWEEIWRGQPMIDQKGDLWVVPTVIVILTYFIGGSIAGRHRRKPRGAAVQGIVLAVSTSLVLIIADVPRRLALAKGLPLNVIGLWLEAAAGTVVIATLGGLFGRWVYRTRRRRSVQMAKHG
jgi:hypothetical protein